MKLTSFIISMIIVGFASFGKFGNSHFKVPKGCDEFGYLHFAEAIDQHKTFQDHTARPFAKGLIDTLIKEEFNYSDFNWLITPHAYHYTYDLNKTICQYAPGTSFLISFFPEWLRGVAFTILSLLLLFWVLTYIIHGKFWYKLCVSLLLLMIIYLAPPFINELNWVNSVAPTLSILLLAGAAAFELPIFALFLVAFSANFRQVNLLMLLPLSIPLFMKFNRYPLNDSVKYLIYCGLAILLGIAPYLIYSYLQFGNPIHLSYSPLDKQFVNTKEALDNISFYFNLSNPWFNLSLITFAACIWMFKKRLITKAVFIFIWTLFIVNYAFFISHKIHLNYYTYASTIIALGSLLHYIPQIPLKTRYLQFAYFGILALFTIDGFTRLDKQGKEKFKESKEFYSDLCAYDVVWGNEYSGTSEFICQNNGFVLHGGTKKARAVIFKYLYNHHYSQAILLNDMLLPPKTVISELDKIGLKHKIITSEHLGAILEIDGN